MYASLMPHAKKSLTPRKILPLKWDKEEASNVLSFAEMKRKLEEVAIKKKLNGK